MHQRKRKQHQSAQSELTQSYRTLSQQMQSQRTHHQPDFLQALQHQAAKQSRLHRYRFLPRQVDWLTALIGRYPWQVVLVTSGVAALLMSVLR